jgi:hypothetical protein
MNMVVKTEKNTAEYILPLDINGLQGRMLRLPRPFALEKNGKFY